jgi:acetoin utilization deacetylase AcuC-like enzyme
VAFAGRIVGRLASRYNGGMDIITNPQQDQHDPPFELLDGRRVAYFEAPRRVAIITAALAEAGFVPPVAPQAFDLAPILAVHHAGYVAYLESAYAHWTAAGLPADAVLPSALPLIGSAERAAHPTALAGRYMFDLSAPITAGTYAAARGAVDAALTGAATLLRGERSAYALCRPPGHHAAPALAGGYCFLNNAAVAANYLARGGVIAGAATDDGEFWGMRAPVVAVLDIDYHHGNGTQAIFYERSDVFCVSIHADPAREYPFYLGFADERGAHAGEGYNLNLPLEAGIDDVQFQTVLDQALNAIAAYGPRYLVVSAGFDTFIDDPLGDFALTTAGYEALGAQIAQLGLPTLFVQEGGYAVEALGRNVVSLLAGFVQG